MPGFENWSPLQPPDDGSDDVNLVKESFVVVDGMDLIQLDERNVERVPLDGQGQGRGVSGGAGGTVSRPGEVPQPLPSRESSIESSVPRDPGSGEISESSGSQRDSGTRSAPEARESRGFVSESVNNHPVGNDSMQGGLPGFLAVPPSILDTRQNEIIVDEGDYSIPSGILNYDEVMESSQPPHPHVVSRKRKIINSSDDVSPSKKRK
uniref:Uncharacterized protein n=1 Tax=Trichogramma kaykai TaxID=54128 RepID=A0ABD2W9E8_9HYME